MTVAGILDETVSPGSADQERLSAEGNKMEKISGYRLHIEATTEEPTAYRTMAEVRQAQRYLAKEYDRTFAEIDAMSYIVTEEKYQAEKAQA